MTVRRNEGEKPLKEEEETKMIGIKSRGGGLGPRYEYIGIAGVSYI